MSKIMIGKVIEEEYGLMLKVNLLAFVTVT